MKKTRKMVRLTQIEVLNLLGQMQKDDTFEVDVSTEVNSPDGGMPQKRTRSIAKFQSVQEKRSKKQ